MVVAFFFATTQGRSADAAGDGVSPEMPGDASSPAEHGGATTVDAKEHAKQLYDQGLEAYKEHRFRDALDALLAAADAYPSPLFYFNISLVYEAMGDSASALAWLRRYVRETGGVPDADAAKKVSALEQRLQQDGVQQVSVFSVPDGGLVDIDGRSIGVAPVTTQLVPGRHLVTIALLGYASARDTIELRADKSMDVKLELTPAASPTPAPPTPAPAVARPSGEPAERPAAPKRAHRVSVWSVALFGAGTAALGTALTFEVLGANSESAARSASQVDYGPRVREMQSQETWSRVFLGVGAAFVVAGGVKLWFDLSDGSGAQRSAGMTSCGYGGLCGAAKGEF
jgi:hypothetical protein